MGANTSGNPRRATPPTLGDSRQGKRGLTYQYVRTGHGGATEDQVLRDSIASEPDGFRRLSCPAVLAEIVGKDGRQALET